MSSHHIVKEKQEPALLIMDLQDYRHEQLGQLLEWSPTVLVNESEYEHADSLGIKIDVLINQANSVKMLQPGTLQVFAGDKPLEDALKFLCGEQYPAVNIVNNTFRLKDYAGFAERINLVIITPHYKIFPVRSGFSKWRPAGERVEILSEVPGLKTSGLRKANEQVFITGKEGFYTLSFDKPFIFVAEEY